MLIKVLIKEKADFMRFHVGFFKLFHCYLLTDFKGHFRCTHATDI